jgi:hypothetical protein
MITDQGFTLQDAMDELCNGVIEAVAERPGETAAMRSIRRQTVAHTVTSFQPRDPLEAMLAGQCVIFDQVFRDAMRASTRGQPAATTFRTRSQIHGTGRMFLAHLKVFMAMHAVQVEDVALQPAEQDHSPAEAALAHDPEAPAAPEPDQARAQPDAGVQVSAVAGEFCDPPVTPDTPGSQPIPQPIASRSATHVTRMATQASSADPGAQASEPGEIQPSGGSTAVVSGTASDQPETDANDLPYGEPSARTLQQGPTRLADADIPSALPATPLPGVDAAESAAQPEQPLQLAQAALARDAA